MNKSIRRVAAALGVLFLALFVNLNVQQIVPGQELPRQPGKPARAVYEYAIPRGDITVGGTAVAHSKATSGTLKYLRVYPDGPVYAPVTGFYSLSATPSSVIGTTGIETAENSVLSGDDPRLFGTRLTDLLTGRNPRGGWVELTIDKASQQAAYQNLIKGANGQPRRGAVVALDPRTGAILAAVSTPSYNPSKLSLHDPARSRRTFRKLNRDPANPLLNRAFNQLYPPGSTFKIVVSAAALKKGIKPDDKLIAPNGYYPETGRTASACPAGSVNCIENFDGESCDGGQFATLLYSFAKSCNTTFAALADEQLGGHAIAEQAKLFGFDRSPPLQVPLPVARSTVGTKADLTAKGFLARTAFGQQDVRMTTLQGAMLPAAVANDGTLMQPYLVVARGGAEPRRAGQDRTHPARPGDRPDPRPAAAEDDGAVVTSPEGTGQPAAIPGVVVGGKTGTADTGRKLPNGQDEPPDAWFTGYAMVNGTPKIAVAVIIENGGVAGNETTGGEAAAPVAKAVIEAYLKGHPG